MANCSARGGEEDVDQRGDDDADHAHEQERAPARQILLRRVAERLRRAERRRGDEEHPRDRAMGIDQEDRRERRADQRGVNPEGVCAALHAHLMQPRGHEEHHAERRKQQHPFQRADENQPAEFGEHRAVRQRRDRRAWVGRDGHREHDVGDDAGNRETRRPCNCRRAACNARRPSSIATVPVRAPAIVCLFNSAISSPFETLSVGKSVTCWMFTAYRVDSHSNDTITNLPQSHGHGELRPSIIRHADMARLSRQAHATCPTARMPP